MQNLLTKPIKPTSILYINIVKRKVGEFFLNFKNAFLYLFLKTFINVCYSMILADSY